MQEKITQLQLDVTVGQDDVTQLLIKKLKSDRGAVFKTKGHEAQFCFNSDVEDHIGCALTKAAKLITNDETSKTIDTLHEELRSGMRAIATRQKLIKIADWLELGWAVVEAYESNDLLSDSNDEKRQIKADI